MAGLKQARNIFTTNVTRPIVIGNEVYPGLNVSSDAQILSLIQENAAAIYHASVTFGMGLANDSMAILYSKARVYGVQGLRVVDASAVPALPPGYPSSAIIKLNKSIV